MLQLDIHRGLPMFFLKERKRGELKTRITFSNHEKSAVGDKLIIGVFIYKIDEITELRDSPLDYGTDKPVFFHDCKTTLCGRFEGRANERKEVAVTEPVDKPIGVK